MKTVKTPAPIGRPRSFDPDEVLNRAMDVFWRKGYEGTSLSDLTAAIGINRPSLYAAFGNKEALFRKVLDRYLESRGAHSRRALEQVSAREVASVLLRGAVELITDPVHPKGCLGVQGALACGEEAEPLRRELADRRAAVESALRERLERAQAEGDLPRNAVPADLARYLMTMAHGLAVQANGGVGREELLRVVEIALAAWPE